MGIPPSARTRASQRRLRRLGWRVQVWAPGVALSSGGEGLKCSGGHACRACHGVVSAGAVADAPSMAAAILSPLNLPWSGAALLASLGLPWERHGGVE